MKTLKKTYLIKAPVDKVWQALTDPKMIDDWDQPSKVTFDLSQKNGKIKISLLHENIPDSEASDISDGWDSYYLGPMKEYLELCF